MAYLSLRDMFDGGGAGRSGDTFQGGPFSGMLNTMGAKPLGFYERQREMEAQSKPMNGGVGSPAVKAKLKEMQAQSSNKGLSYGMNSATGLTPRTTLSYGLLPEESAGYVPMGTGGLGTRVERLGMPQRPGQSRDAYRRHQGGRRPDFDVRTDTLWEDLAMANPVEQMGGPKFSDPAANDALKWLRDNGFLE